MSLFKSKGRYLALTVVALLSFVMPSQTSAQVSSGDILVTDLNAGTATFGALFSVDPATGQRTILSDFGDSTQGPTGIEPAGLTIDASGNVLVTDLEAGTAGSGALFSVDPATGQRTILSDFGDSTQGPTGIEPVDVVIDASGNVLVTDLEAGTAGSGALFSVDPATGQRTILSDFGNAAQGPLGSGPAGLTIDASGNVLVTDLEAGTVEAGAGPSGALFSVDPATGQRTILSDFGDSTQGPTGLVPIGVDLDASGKVLVATDSFKGFAAVLFSVDPATGQRTIVSDFTDSTQGPLGDFITFLAIDASGNVLVTDIGAGPSGALFSVDPATGQRTILSDFGDSTQGPTGIDPIGVVIVPPIDVPPPLPASVEISPDTINQKSKGKFVEALVEFLGGEADATEIDPASMTMCNDSTGNCIPVAPGSPVSIGDANENGVADLTVKFDKAAVVSSLTSGPGTYDLTVKGRLVSGEQFEGTDTVVVF